MTEHDAAIIEAAEKLCGAYGQHGPWERQHVDLLCAAIEANREAAKPKPLTAEEAYQIWDQASRDENGPALFPWQAVLDAVLDADRASVIEALPRKTIPIHRPDRVEVEMVEMVELADIRTALTGSRS